MQWRGSYLTSLSLYVTLLGRKLSDVSYTMLFVRQFLFEGQLVFLLQLHVRSSSTFVVDIYDRFDVRHATVADLDAVFVEDSVTCVVAGSAF